MFEDRELARESTGFPSGGRGQVLTVSALARSVRDLLEHRYPPLWVTGEISNFTLARSGHVYFSLKDAQAQVRCVMFRSRAQLLDWKPKDGMQVEVHALAGFYEARGEFQLTVEFMRQAGAGALFERFMRLRDRLEREGLFAPEEKRVLPAWPRTIGVVTSTSAAALRDVLTTLARRNPAIDVNVYPTAVQGDGAAEQIAATIELAGRRGECDVLLVVRGGGSIEDLWAFNEEVVARAIRACPVPVVCGVGHETDFTIADFASDQRAPTPTAAAELVSPERETAQDMVRGLARQLGRRVARQIDARMQRLDGVARRLVHPGQRIEARLARLAHLQDSLNRCLETRVAESRLRLSLAVHRSAALLPRTAPLAERTRALTASLCAASRAQFAQRQTRLQHLTHALDHLNPQRVLERGYSVARNARGEIVTRSSQLAPGEALSLRLAHGEARVRVENIERQKLEQPKPEQP